MKRISFAVLAAVVLEIAIPFGPGIVVPEPAAAQAVGAGGEFDAYGECDGFVVVCAAAAAVAISGCVEANTDFAAHGKATPTLFGVPIPFAGVEGDVAATVTITACMSAAAAAAGTWTALPGFPSHLATSADDEADKNLPLAAERPCLSSTFGPTACGPIGVIWTTSQIHCLTATADAFAGGPNVPVGYVFQVAGLTWNGLGIGVRQPLMAHAPAHAESSPCADSAVRIAGILGAVSSQTAFDDLPDGTRAELRARLAEAFHGRFEEAAREWPVDASPPMGELRDWIRGQVVEAALGFDGAVQVSPAGLG